MVSNLIQCQNHLETYRPKQPHKSEPAFYGFLCSVNGQTFPSYVDRMNKVCMGNLKWYPNSSDLEGRECMYYWLLQENNEANIAYLRWVLSGASPWREVLRYQQPQDFDFVVKNGYVATCLDVPSNIFINFFIALRQPFENPDRVSGWYELIQSGVSEGTAFILMSNLYQFGKDEFSVQSEINHYPVRNADGDFSIFKRFYEGRPIEESLSKHTFKQNTLYVPCNTVWTDGKAEFWEFMIDFYRRGGSKDSFKKVQVFKNLNEPNFSYPKTTLKVVSELGKYLDETFVHQDLRKVA